MSQSPTVSDRAMAIDATVIAVISVAICAATAELLFMTILVPALVAGRLLAWSRLPASERGGASMRAELIFYTLCTLLGAFNDWNSVVNHEVYAYTAPHYFPSLSTIPLWMLLFWGMILRFFVTLFRWQRLAPEPTPPHQVRFLPSSPLVKVGLELTIVAMTRQLVYRNYDDPWLSWIPFAVGLVVYALLFGLSRHDRLVVAIFAIGGPIIEIIYINVGDLHHYELGWLGGVPLWIALWWVLAALIWKDLAARLMAAIARMTQGAHSSAKKAT